MLIQATRNISRTQIARTCLGHRLNSKMKRQSSGLQHTLSSTKSKRCINFRPTFVKEELKVQNMLKNSTLEEKRDRIYWGGGMLPRSDFNKRKDPIVNWTEVLFRS